MENTLNTPLLSTLAVTFSMMFAAAAVAKPILIAPNDSFVGAGFGGGGKTIDFVVFAGLSKVDGKVAVCGLVWLESSNGSFVRGEPQITRQLKYSVNGKKIPVQSAKFIRYPSKAEAVSAREAGCSVSRVAWDASFDKAKLEIKGNRLRYTDQ